MAKVDTTTVKDATGKSYTFEVYTPDTSWADIAAIYGFLGARNSSGGYPIFYIGQTSSMRDRHIDHDRWEEAKKLGAKYIMTLVAKDEKPRLALEEALISVYKPRLNTQHKKTGTGR